MLVAFACSFHCSLLFAYMHCSCMPFVSFVQRTSLLTKFRWYKRPNDCMFASLQSGILHKVTTSFRNISSLTYINMTENTLKTGVKVSIFIPNMFLSSYLLLFWVIFTISHRSLSCLVSVRKIYKTNDWAPKTCKNQPASRRNKGPYSILALSRCKLTLSL